MLLGDMGESEHWSEGLRSTKGDEKRLSRDWLRCVIVECQERCRQKGEWFVQVALLVVADKGRVAVDALAEVDLRFRAYP